MLHYKQMVVCVSFFFPVVLFCRHSHLGISTSPSMFSFENLMSKNLKLSHLKTHKMKQELFHHFIMFTCHSSRDSPGGHSSSFEWCSQIVGGPLWRGSVGRGDSAPQWDTAELLYPSVHVVRPAVSVEKDKHFINGLNHMKTFRYLWQK